MDYEDIERVVTRFEDTLNKIDIISEETLIEDIWREYLLNYWDNEVV